MSARALPLPTDAFARKLARFAAQGQPASSPESASRLGRVIHRVLLLKAHGMARPKPGPFVRCGRVMLWLEWLWKRVLWRCVPLVRLFGVPVQMHTSWLLFPGGWFAFLAGLDLLQPLLAALVLACVLPSLLVHEFAHVLMGRWFGWHTHRVVFFPFGCVALMEEDVSGRGEFWVALAGPVSSALIALGAGLFLWSRGMPPSLDWVYGEYPVSSVLLVLNGFIAWFNLIPCYPMDGGRLVRAALSCCLYRRSRRAAHQLATLIVVRWVGLPAVFGVLVLTVWKTHIWSHLGLFPLVWLAGELELRARREMPLARVKLLTLNLHAAEAWKRSLCANRPPTVVSASGQPDT